MSAKRFRLSKWETSIKLMGAVTLSMAIMAGCSAGSGASSSSPAPTSEVQTIKSVKAAKVAKQSIGAPLEQVADVLPIVQIDIMAKSGGDVLEVLKRRGEMVQAGDVILKLDPKDIELSREKLQLALSNSVTALENARKDLTIKKTEMANGVAKAERGLAELTRNYNELRNNYDLGLVTEVQLDQAGTQLKNTQLDLDILKQQQKNLETTDNLSGLAYQVDSSRLAMKELERSLENLNVKAPVSGVLTDMPIVSGMTLTPGYRIGQVQQLNPIKIKALLTEDGAKLVRGKKELNYSLPGTEVKGKAPLTFLSDVLDSQSKSYEMELEVKNEDGKLRPGMKVQIQLTDEQEQIVVAVPTLSIVREGGDSFVFVLKGDTVEKRLVKLGRLNGLNQEILSGVQEGESLVISGQNQLKDKEKVQVAADNK
ncbi:efflux RND transporter periplasmic adaptor subunit [Gorillibacterium sp. sgz5001074]|uniref:efflux RND transporter periplasmic adaptor subunit n=1 Tax=Gorillibacterium sp. sgz5001074 TaxID=3446695 RepID=UPI003F682110